MFLKCQKQLFWQCLLTIFEFSFNYNLCCLGDYLPSLLNAYKALLFFQGFQDQKVCICELEYYILIKNSTTYRYSKFYAMMEINQNFGFRLKNFRFESLFVDNHVHNIMVLLIDNPLLIYFLDYNFGNFYDLTMNICQQTFTRLKLLMEKV